MWSTQNTDSKEMLSLRALTALTKKVGFGFSTQMMSVLLSEGKRRRGTTRHQVFSPPSFQTPRVQPQRKT